MKRKREDENNRETKRRKIQNIKERVVQLKKVKVILNKLKEKIKTLENINDSVNDKKLKLNKYCRSCFKEDNLVKVECTCDNSICNKCLDAKIIKEDTHMFDLICNDCRYPYFRPQRNNERLKKEKSLLQICFFE